MLLPSGTQVGGYLIEGVLGHGGMGVVYEARQLTLNRKVALKLLTPQLGTDASFRERFRHEGRIQAALDHPNIVSVYEAGEIPEGLYLVMRLIRGPTLKELIVARELEGARTLRILTPIADALDTAHEAGLIHRDIKPQNILVGDRDRAYLADFGLTKGIGEQGLTRTGQFLGTIDYIAPEQIRGEPASACSDVYSLAAVLYECLVGVVPYARPSDAAVMYAHLSEPPPLVTDQRPDLPAALDAVLARGMAKRPADRHATAGELLLDAERAFGRKIRAVITPPGPVAHPEETGIRESEAQVPTLEARLGRADRAAGADSEEAGREEAGAPATTVAGSADAHRRLSSRSLLGAVGPTPEASLAPSASPAATPTIPSRGRDRRARAHTGDSAPADEALRSTAVSADGDVATVGASSTGAERVSPGRRAASAWALPAAAVTVVALVCGYLAGRPSTPEPVRPAALSGRLVGGNLALRYPAGWQRRAELPAVPGLQLARASGAGPATQPAAGVMAGSTRGEGRRLLPPSLRARLMAAPPAPDSVRAGALQALRYRNLQVRGLDGRRLTLYLAPTTSGTAAIACYAPTNRVRAFARDCDRVAATGRLTKGEAYALAPDRRYARALARVLDDLRAARRLARARLKAARTPRRQATAAADAASAYRRASTRVAGLKVSPVDAAANRRIAAALRANARAYRRLANAARMSRRAGYRSASRDVTRSERRVSSALAALKSLGYRVS